MALMALVAYGVEDLDIDTVVGENCRYKTNHSIENILRESPDQILFQHTISRSNNLRDAYNLEYMIIKLNNTSI